MSKLLEKIKTGKPLEIVIICILAVIVLFTLYNAFGKKEDETVSENNYYSELEEKLVSVLSNIEGAGEVSVMITYSDGGEKIIAYETVEKADGSVVKTPILINGEVVVLEEKTPEILGVLIVSSGANNLAVRFNLIDAAASVLNTNKSIIKVYES